ncbi:MAG TPA: ribosomal L7Ae/L30e/S12e/Gadd45 family protein [Bacillota bacterium]|nr:ribosomal L7Ae/L30e/S12e/Gadd45 family protein [Bacillota bacterium]
MTDKFATLLGFAQRAGKIVSGESAAQAALKKNKGNLIIIAQDASQRTKSGYQMLGVRNKVPCIETGTQYQLGLTIGRSPRSVIVVIDEGFAKTLLEYLNEETCRAE